MRDTAAARHSPKPYELFMLCLSLFALAAIATTAFVPITGESRTILQWADTLVCALFFVDFLVLFYRAPSRWRYFFTWGWVDLLSSIPSIDVLRWGRAARILRVFHLFRLIKTARVLTAFILHKRDESAFLAAVLAAILLVTCSSILILQLETAADANIKGAGDALWWSLVTLTTVGYGDRFPVTMEGRVVGVFLMVAGVGLLGTLSGLVASWFLSPAQKRDRNETELLRAEIAELRTGVAMLLAKDTNTPATEKERPPGGGQ